MPGNVNQSRKEIENINSLSADKNQAILNPGSSSNDLKSSFGSCQDLQRRVSYIMNQSNNFNKLFDIEEYKQLLGAHNFVIITDKETKKEYQADPWYLQKLENSIKPRNIFHHF